MVEEATSIVGKPEFLKDSFPPVMGDGRDAVSSFGAKCFVNF